MIPTYRQYLFRPFRPIGPEENALNRVVGDSYLTFRIESQDLGVNVMLDPAKSWCRYRCYDCLYACGDYVHGSATIYQPATHMKDGPTDFQRDEISEHSRQHSIMWAWVNSIERKK